MTDDSPSPDDRVDMPYPIDVVRHAASAINRARITYLIVIPISFLVLIIAEIILIIRAPWTPLSGDPAPTETYIGCYGGAAYVLLFLIVLTVLLRPYRKLERDDPQLRRYTVSLMNQQEEEYFADKDAKGKS